MYKWDRSNRVLTSVKNVGANAIENSKSFAVFPNPTRGTLNIVSASLLVNDLTITVRNIQGAEMMNKVYQNIGGEFNQTIDISGLSQGLYFVILQSGSNFETHKVVLLK
jgi:hypothetical protein